MAYEKEIKAGLKNKFHSDLGLSDSTYEKVANILGATTTSEDQVETVVTGAEGWLKIAQGEADIVRKNPKPQPKPTPKPTDPPTDPPTDIESIIAKAVAPLMKKIETLEKGNSSKAYHEKLIARLTEKKIDPGYYEAAIEGREFGSDDELTAFVDKLSGSYEKFNQSLADKGLSNIPKPILGDPNAEGVSSAVQSYIDSKKDEGKASPLGGKAL